MDEVRTWLLRFAQARAEQVVAVPGGLALLHSGYPLAHDHNRLVVVEPASAEEIARAADEVLGGAGLAHRLVEVLPEDAADRLRQGLTARGFRTERVLVMEHDGSPSAPDPRVERLAEPDRVAAATATWRSELPDAGPEAWQQLGARAATLRAVPETVFLAVRAPDGAVAARADLYLRDGLAQVEDVVTQPEHREQGYATALVRTAVSLAAEAGARRTFLLADADDWPQHLYRRLGFVATGTTTSFAR